MFDATTTRAPTPNRCEPRENGAPKYAHVLRKQRREDLALHSSPRSTLPNSWKRLYFLATCTAGWVGLRLQSQAAAHNANTCPETLFSACACCCPLPVPLAWVFRKAPAFRAFSRLLLTKAVYTRSLSGSSMASQAICPSGLPFVRN